MGQSLLDRVREAMIDAAPREPLVSHRDRDMAILNLRSAMSVGDAERQLVCLAAAVELRAYIADDIWTLCRNAAKNSGDAALYRLFRSARGRAFVSPPCRLR